MAPRGRRPKPTHLKVISGNAGRRPLNTAEPDSGGPLGEPPAGWNEGAIAIWREIVESAPAGVLTRSDRHLVELTCRLLAQIRATADVKPATIAQLRCCLAEIGMTPSARSRLFAGGGAGFAGNPFRDFDAE